MRTFNTIMLALFVLVSAACSRPEASSSAVPGDVRTPATGDVAGPRFSQGPDKTLVLSWMERGESETTLKFSALIDDEFSEASDVVSEPRMFVNWADLPSVTPMGGNHLVAHWLRYSADK